MATADAEVGGLTNVRSQVLAFVRDYPGVHAREVERQLGLSSRLASYHLDALEDQGLVQRIAEKGYARFMPAATRPRWSAGDVAFVCLMRRGVAFRCVVLLLARGEMTQGDLSRTLHLARASTSYHLRLLIEAGVVAVEQRAQERWHRLVNPAYVRGILADFHPLPEDLNPFERVWDDLFD